MQQLAAPVFLGDKQSLLHECACADVFIKLKVEC